jgi:acyl carrier protein
MMSVSVEEIRQVVAAAWCAALRLESLPPNANIFLVGGDSLNAVLIAADLNERLGTEIGLSDFLDAPTFDEFIDRIAQFVAGNQG